MEQVINYRTMHSLVEIQKNARQSIRSITTAINILPKTFDLGFIDLSGAVDYYIRKRVVIVTEGFIRTLNACDSIDENELLQRKEALEKVCRMFQKLIRADKLTKQSFVGKEKIMEQLDAVLIKLEDLLDDYSLYADKKLIKFLTKEEKAIEKGKTISAEEFLRQLNVQA